jgi:hypothetical protein
MFTRAIFIRPDSELIRESVCACAKLFFDEESTWHKSNRGSIKNYHAILLSKYDSAEKNILNYAYVLKNGVGRYNIFLLIFAQSLLNPPFCVVFV